MARWWKRKGEDDTPEENKPESKTYVIGGTTVTFLPAPNSHRGYITVEGGDPKDRVLVQDLIFEELLNKHTCGTTFRDEPDGSVRRINVEYFAAVTEDTKLPYASAEAIDHICKTLADKNPTPHALHTNLEKEEKDDLVKSKKTAEVAELTNMPVFRRHAQPHVDATLKVLRDQNINITDELKQELLEAHAEVELEKYRNRQGGRGGRG